MLWVKLLDAGKSFQVQSSEESLENGIDIDAPQVTVLINFGLELKNQLG